MGYGGGLGKDNGEELIWRGSQGSAHIWPSRCCSRQP